MFPFKCLIRLMNTKKITFFILIILANNSFLFSQTNTKCPNFTQFGGKLICLPEISEMTEVAAHNDELRQILTLNNSEITLGYYMSANLISSYVDEDECLTECDGIKVYSVKQLENLNADSDILNLAWKETIKIFKSNDLEDFFNKSLDKSKLKDLNISNEDPLFIGEFNLNPKIKTAIVLMEFNIKDTVLQNPYKIGSINITIINQRLIYYAYFASYEGRESIEYIKTKSNAFGRKLLSVNNIY